MSNNVPTIADLLSFFPEVSLPFTITEESMDHFRLTNEDLPFALVNAFLEEWEGVDEDDMTEYFPCLKLPSEEQYECIIYWRAAFLKYEYILTTINKAGEVIARRVIAGSRYEGSHFLKSAARVDEDRIIHIMTGIMSADQNELDPELSKPYNMEIMPSGEIISYKE
ncbi:MAG: hypothetical protein IPL23_19670 [Saprospiraceae bacterium]|nr:hypothetical protein [Saprospiraceae bacterium]HMS68732.1 hypothetical protein [Saprospiraceae bacterium]